MWLSREQTFKVHGVLLECMHGQKLSYRSVNVVYTPSRVHLWCWSVYLWVSDLCPCSGILVYTYRIRSVVGVYTPVGLLTEWFWSVHSKLECTLSQGKGSYARRHQCERMISLELPPRSYMGKCYIFNILYTYSLINSNINFICFIFVAE